MTQRRIALILTFLILATPLAALAQPAGKVYRIGWLGFVTPTRPEEFVEPEAFLQALREPGSLEFPNYLRGLAELVGSGLVSVVPETWHSVLTNPGMLSIHSIDGAQRTGGVTVGYE